MNITREEIHNLEQWLESRLDSLTAHTEKVKELLTAAEDTEKRIIDSATNVALTEPHESTALSPSQIAVWKALLPIISEHSLLVVRGGCQTLQEDQALNKRDAAEYLGISQRKLQRHMKKRQIEYEKYGTGRTASVRFRLSELIRFRESRQVTARKVNL